MLFDVCTTETTALLQSLIVARDKERDELGNVLQDNVSQLLASARLLIELAGERGVDSSGSLDKGLLYLNLAMKEIRKIAQSCNSGVVNDIGLEAAIGTWMEAGRAEHRIDTCLEYDNDLDDILSPALKLMIYRVVQEQTDNIYRYSGARCISIELQRMDQSLYFSISDDGKGFDTKPARKGMGFIIIQNRVDAFDGAFSLHSAPGTGCHLEMKIPLPAPPTRQSFSGLSQ